MEKSTGPAARTFNSGPYNCPRCPKSYRMLAYLRKHEKAHAELNNLKCNLCNKQFEIKSDYRRHNFYNHSQDRPFKCTYCGNMFKTKSHLRSHEDIHSGRKTFQCKTCHKRFRRRDGFEQHVARHSTQGRPVVCGICCAKFREQRSLTIHIQQTHGIGNPGKLECIFCNKHIRTTQNFERHINVHIEERPHLCEICPSEFRSNIELSKHLLTHDPKRKRNFSCDLCLAAFHTNSLLQRHIRGHTGEKAYKCQICGKEWHELGNFKAHQATHKKKSHSCSICNNVFATKYTLMTHINTHVQERHFECRHCNETFISMRRCRTHEKNHNATE